MGKVSRGNFDIYFIKLSKVDFDWVKQKFPSRNFTGVLKGDSFKFIIVNRVTKTMKKINPTIHIPYKINSYQLNLKILQG